MSSSAVSAVNCLIAKPPDERKASHVKNWRRRVRTRGAAPGVRCERPASMMLPRTLVDGRMIRLRDGEYASARTVRITAPRGTAKAATRGSDGRRAARLRYTGSK